MRHLLSTFALSCAVMVSLTVGASPAVAATAQSVSADEPTARVIVKFKADSTLLERRQALAVGERHTQRAQGLGKRVGLALESGASVSDRAQVVFAKGIDSATLAARLGQEADVEYAVVDHRRRRLTAPNDPLYPNGQLGAAGPAVGQWYLRAPAGEAKSAINAEAAWNVTTGNANIVVAVLDTGVRFDHIDLQPVAAGGKLLPGYDMISDVNTSNDGDGRDPDPSDPGDWVSDADKTGNPGAFGDCDVENSSWHGTQTAGLIGAITNNGIGMASVAPEVRILPVRVLGKCGGWDSDIIAGMRWAVGLPVDGVPANPNPARVLNLSLGSDGPCSASTGYPNAIAEINAAGAVVVASAGNDAGHAVSVPANCPGVIAVAGLRQLGTKVGFSNIGPEVALSAPAGNCVTIGPGDPCQYPILTTSNSGTTVPNAGGSIFTDSFNASLGTSFSAPLVAGTAALMLSVQPTLSPASVRAILRSTARPFVTTGGTAGSLQCHAPNGTDQLECYCTTSTCGAGMLDAGAAVAAVAANATLQAVIGVTPALPTAGATITLSAAGSVPGSGHSIVAWQWALTDGGGIVTGFTGPIDAATASVIPSAAGTFTVSLTVTDEQAHTSTVSRSIAVAAPPTPVPPAAGGGGGGGGGGGALGVEWLAGLAIGIAALRRPRDRSRSRDARR